MKGLEKKFKKQMDAAQLAAMLREIADELEGAAQNSNAPLEGAFNDFHKARLKIKRKTNRLSVEVKVESQAPLHPADTSPADPASDLTIIAGNRPQTAAKGHPAADRKEKPEYKNLKKRLKSTFKQIRTNLETGQLPATEIMESFLQDSQLMLSYPGHGDAHYAAYQNLCSHFSTAYNRGDIDAVRSVYTELSQMKSDCHKRYK